MVDAAGPVATRPTINSRWWSVRRGRPFLARGPPRLHLAGSGGRLCVELQRPQRSTENAAVVARL